MTDYDAIRNLLAQYCHLLDDGDYDEWAELFTLDARYGSAASPKVGRLMIRQFMDSYAPEIRRESRHLTTNSVIRVTGDTATAASDFIVVRRTRLGGIFVRGGRYNDRLVKQGADWLFADRTIVSTAWHPPISTAYLGDWTDPSPQLP